MKKITAYILFFVVIAAHTLTAVPRVFAGNPLQSPLLNRAANQAGYNVEVDAETIVTEIIGRVIFAMVSFIGIFFIMLIIYGGYIWMNAKGDEADVQKAKRIIRDAIIGLMVLTGAYSVWFVVYEILLSV